MKALLNSRGYRRKLVRYINKMSQVRDVKSAITSS